MNKAINKFLASSLALLIFTSVVAATDGSPMPSFIPATNFPMGTSPQIVTVGDFNLDGIPDLATANQESNNVSVRLGDGSGAFGRKTDFPAGRISFAVAVGDLNRDGKPDLVTANLGGDNVSVLLGDGTGGFEPKVDFPAGRQPSFVAVGDLNVDGNPDLAVANEAGNDVSVLFGNGSGEFRRPPINFTVGTFPVSVAVADFNLDGRPDLVTANLLSNNLSVLLGEGLGQFGPKTDFPVGILPVPVTVGDFNRDGYPDLATANFGSGDGSGPSSVSVLLGDGKGGFGEKTDFPAPNGAIWATVGDFNLDSRLDLATANQSSNNVSVLSGDGYGGFGEPTNFAVGQLPFSVAVGDLNLDGKPDLASANSGSNNVSVLINNLNRCPRPVGFWKNHPDRWPVGSLSLGSRSYRRARLLALLNTPPRGDASLILGRQLIAAKLNLANGSDPAPIEAAVSDADRLLSAFAGKLPYNVRPSSETGKTMTRIANEIESYNHGRSTPEVCVP